MYTKLLHKTEKTKFEFSTHRVVQEKIKSVSLSLLLATETWLS